MNVVEVLAGRGEGGSGEGGSTTQQNPEDILGPLPSGWERRETPTGRAYYVDHSSRTTQFTDPRLTGEWTHVMISQNEDPLLILVRKK